MARSRYSAKRACCFHSQRNTFWPESKEAETNDIRLTKSAYHDRLIAETVHGQTWNTAFTYICKRPEQINVLERHSAVLALEWAVSHPIINHSIIMHSDSTAAIGALTKGRLSSPGMLFPCQNCRVISIAQNVLIRLVHVRTAHNPADGPSRLKQIQSQTFDQ